MRWLVAGLALLGWSSSLCAQPEVMQFEAYPPDAFMAAVIGDHTWKIFGSGRIDNDAGKRLEGLLAAKRITRGSQLYLHSPGGSLGGGMMLGRAIRQHDLATNVGRLDRQSHDNDAMPGECYSACAMAFLGGEYRWLLKGSKYGVHRFFWDKRTEQDVDLAQMMSASVVEYIRSMDVDTKLFSLASQAGPSEMTVPNEETLKRLNVINNGAKKVRWTIESISAGMYLKGEQETYMGTNKFMITCPASSRALEVYTIFDSGQRAAEVMDFAAASLMINFAPVPLESRFLRRENHHGKINMFYPLNAELLNVISTARAVGVALQPTREAAWFVGFAGMAFEEGAKKLPGFIQVCRKGR
jgi:hypothetical protein